jgi:hypothetical protein
MRKGWGVSVIVMLVLSLACGSVFAASSKVGTSGAQFLKIGAGARASGMGGVYTGVSDDVSAIYWNPGGIAQIQSPQALYTYNRWFQDISHQFAAYAMPINKFGVVGIGLTLLGVSDMEKRAADTEEKDGTFTAQDLAVALSYGRQINDVLMLGANVKFLSSKIDTENASGVAVDVGAMVKTGVQGLNLGLAVTNIGSKYKFVDEGDPLPMAIKAGAGYKLLNDSLTLAADVILPNDNNLQVGGGVEYALKFGDDTALALRTGYKTGVDTGGISGLGAGLGISYKMFGFDFAWSPYGDLGDAIRGSLSLKF